MTGPQLDALDPALGQALRDAARAIPLLDDRARRRLGVDEEQGADGP